MQDKPTALIERFKGLDKDIWLLGGSKLARSFFADNLIDEIVLTIVPVTLGEGISLDLSLSNFTLGSANPCMDGIVQRVYLHDKH